ncbi:MAG: TIGR03546 family protein [Elusimicrobiota bacterium]|jgi:uncharacterized protein (TIGR03546 family)
MLLKPLRYLAQALAAQDSPRRLAAGFALGAFAGLIPKSSLFAQIALMLIAALQVNAAAGYCSAALFSLLAPVLDPLTHRIGLFFLTGIPALGPLWTRLYNLPVAPWTGFNNTVTLGSVIVGAIVLYPFYKLMTPVFARYSETLGARIRRFKVTQLLLGADTAGRFS